MLMIVVDHVSAPMSLVCVAVQYCMTKQSEGDKNETVNSTRNNDGGLDVPAGTHLDSLRA